MNKDQMNMWENDASLVPVTKEGEELKQDMLFSFMNICPPASKKDWLSPEDQVAFDKWLKVQGATKS